MAGLLSRPTEKTDIGSLARIRAREWGGVDYWERRIAGYLAGELHPQQALPPRGSYVAVDADAVIGFVAGHLTRRYGCGRELEWILEWINVVGESRGRGVATELLRRMAAWFVQNGALKVCVDVEPENAIARAFYTRNGAETLNRNWLVWNDIRRLTAPL